MRHRTKEDRPDSFAEQQAQLARDSAERMKFLGQDLLQVLQGVSCHDICQDFSNFFFLQRM